MINRYAIIACWAVAICELSGCATRTYRADAPPPETTLLTTYQAQVAIGDCVFKPPTRDPAAMSALATALASSAVTQGVNYLARALEEAAKGANDRITAARNLEVSANSFGECVQVVRGWFYRGFDSISQRSDALDRALRTWARPGSGAIDAPTLPRFWDRRLWIAAQPDFVFEAEILATELAAKPDTRVLTLAPIYARLDAPISKAALRPSSSRDVAVFFAFHEANADPAAPSNASGGLALGKLQPAADVRFPASNAVMHDTPNRSAEESRWFTVALGTSKKAMTLTALVTEHQDASAFLEFLADVVTGARTPVAAALQTALVPAVQAQADETDAAKLESARTAYEEALTRALATANACSAVIGDAVSVASDARSRTRTFNRAARALGRPMVAEDLVPLSIDAGAVQAGCVKLRDALRRVI